MKDEISEEELLLPEEYTLIGIRHIEEKTLTHSATFHDKGNTTIVEFKAVR